MKNDNKILVNTGDTIKVVFVDIDSKTILNFCRIVFLGDLIIKDFKDTINGTFEINSKFHVKVFSFDPKNINAPLLSIESIPFYKKHKPKDNFINISVFKKYKSYAISYKLERFECITTKKLYGHVSICRARVLLMEKKQNKKNQQKNTVNISKESFFNRFYIY